MPFEEALKYANTFNGSRFWGEMSIVDAVCSSASTNSQIVLKTKLFKAARKLYWASNPFGNSGDDHLKSEVLGHYKTLKSGVMTYDLTFKRFKGSLFGLILGDIIGSYYEFSSRCPKSIPDLEQIAKLKNIFGIPLGYTDDTILTLLAMDAFVDDLGEFNAITQHKHAASYLFESTKWSPNGKCFDIGITTRNSLISLDWQGKTSSENSGNGVLMKLAPYALTRLFCENTGLENYYYAVVLTAV